MRTRHFITIALGATLMLSCERDPQLNEAPIIQSVSPDTSNYALPLNATNDQKTLNDLFTEDRLYVEVGYFGCFNMTKDRYVIYKSGNMHKIMSLETGKETNMNAGDMDKLKSYLRARIGTNTDGGCTGGKWIKIGTPNRCVGYDHNYCSGIESTLISKRLKLDQLL